MHHVLPEMRPSLAVLSQTVQELGKRLLVMDAKADGVSLFCKQVHAYRALHPVASGLLFTPTQ